MVADTCTALPWDMVGYQPVLYSVRKECFKCLHRHPFGTQCHTKVFFFWGTGFIKDIFRCFYFYAFKEHAFVSKKAKILFLLRCAWKGTRTGLFLISFAWPHGQVGPPLYFLFMATWTGWSSFIGQELSVFQWLHLGLLSLSTTLNPFYRLHCTRMHPSI